MTEVVKLISGGTAHVLTQADRFKGGKAVTKQKKYGALVRQSAKAKCMNCKSNCMLKEANLAQKKGYLCPIPAARAFSITYDMPIMSEEILLKLSAESLMKLYENSKSNRDLKMLCDAIENKLKNQYPKESNTLFQQNIQINVLSDEEKDKIIKNLLGEKND